MILLRDARSLVPVTTLWLAACGGGEGAPPDAPPVVDDAAVVIDGAVAIDAAVDPIPMSTDCTLDDPGCPVIAIAGDAPAPGAARGFADPSMRADFASPRIWLAYSWPRARSLPSGGGVVTVDNHLAHSDDGGATFTLDGPMWTAEAATSPVDGTDGYYNQETVALAPDAARGMWYSARLHYLTVADGPMVASFQIRIAAAAAPTGLAAAAEQVLGGSVTTGPWAPDVDLSALDATGELHGCVFSDPGVIVDGGSLYLAVECQRFTPSGEDPTTELIAVFATTPTGPVTSWTWTYRGALARYDDAVALGGSTLLQSELARDHAGGVLFVVSPSEPALPLATHLGCAAVSIASLSDPALARFPSGALALRASATASDLAPTGPGSCTYEPAAATGLVLVRRHFAPGILDNTLVATGLAP